MPNIQRGDLRYYWGVHCDRQKAQGNHPVCYTAFTRRIKKMNLHDAIYKPRVEYNVRHPNRTPIQDAVRRSQINKEENIQILDLDNLRLLEMKELKTTGKSRYVFVKPKKKWWNRLLDFLLFNNKQ